MLKTSNTMVVEQKDKNATLQSVSMATHVGFRKLASVSELYMWGSVQYIYHIIILLYYILRWNLFERSKNLKYPNGKRARFSFQSHPHSPNFFNLSQKNNIYLPENFENIPKPCSSGLLIPLYSSISTSISTLN